MFYKKRFIESLESLKSLKEKNETLERKNNDLKALSSSTESFFNTIDYFESKGIYIPFYRKGNDVYIIYAHSKGNIDGIFDANFRTIKMNNKKEICKADIEIKLHDVKREPAYYKTEIINIDTINEPRLGHASRMIKHIIAFSDDFCSRRIYGRIMNNTHIGKENLINFYIKNGFEINGDLFRMIKHEYFRGWC